jgi:hypothetical protein
LPGADDAPGGAAGFEPATNVRVLSWIRLSGWIRFGTHAWLGCGWFTMATAGVITMMMAATLISLRRQ